MLQGSLNMNLVVCHWSYLKTCLVIQHKPSHGQHYSDIAKQFAVALYYYSTKAYEYDQKILHLPHVSSIHDWCSYVNCQPGFLSDVIEQLSKKLEYGEMSCDVSVDLDGMAIRKQT